MLYHEDDLFMSASIPGADGRKLVVECVKGKSVNFKVLPRLEQPKEEDTITFDEGCAGYEAIRNFADSLKSMSQGVVINENAKVKNYMMCLKYQHFVEIMFVNSKHDMLAQNDVTVKVGNKNLGVERAAKMLINDINKIIKTTELNLD